ncbi:hypothetical protein Pint_15639 [Pistacia integerrima]|uniref:Uncharacterized protein n=1 Tax=Pistacia integerrima TaxID=434235 RepID=A0ACC0ZEM2_9ROSI|nr:hypothetical protein Pint_15639 [Pistacia integerrima]
MDLNVEIISRETIQPSSPTPSHLKIYKLSLFDQLAPPVYAPIILFYSPTDENDSSKRSNHLKKSLSKTLTKFYPFAGRVKDGFSIECNDRGAIFIEALVGCDMPTVLKQPEIDQLQQLLPEVSSDQTLLAVQVNYFGCGGIAVSVCIRHVIGDASAAAHFVKTWAAIACGENINIDDAILDCTSLFPPQNFFGFSKNISKNHDLLLNVAMKRFLFDGSKIAALRSKIGKIGPSLDHATRVEAVSALIWSAVIAIATERDKTMPMHVAATAANLRKRLNPPLPQQSIGNIYQVTMANWLMGKTTNYNDLAEKIHESIKKMNNEYIRKLHEGGGYLNIMRNAAEGLVLRICLSC